ncbi:MAG: 30S ribosomal protein S4 [Candidatus Uhrbacteria bacterium]|nr:30S ribosomal protein S4 [Patescibacteria group bacterium]MBU1906745.1 30S ribosomal protein S4 [Patescibacteria group bacterium]
MGKTLKATCKMCRREGVSLCGKEKCAAKRRSFAPGQHGPTRRSRLSPYGIQLREKQKAKRFYNVMERQFRNYFTKATLQKGNTGETLVRFLEMRLDNVVYRLGFASTRRQARQMVNHALFEVNGQKVNIPSYQVRVGDEITIRESKKNKIIFEGLSEKIAKYTTPAWLHMDAATLSGKVTSVPEGEELKQPFDTKLIVEFYSR